MKGKKQGVQARLLNKRALFIPCGAYTMKLVIADSAKSSKDAVVNCQLCEALNTEPELREKRLRSTKRQFAYEAADEPMNDALKKLEVTFFNTVVGSALRPLHDIFETFTEVKETFGVLLDFRQLQGMPKYTL
ncbi:hypothetical protein N1851_008167 [Merluccius polli]|uniref:Uncharacterized protein n=1 Tax=Merluccius polli TaxID=89951 RepID=A0AA47N1L6_MERPO|nr:hypothetical protein N1851_008167 [Merluccius polli]